MTSILLTPEEAANILGLSPFTVRRLLRAGELPGRKVGKRQWRIWRADLDAYLGAPGTSGVSQQSKHTPARIEQLAAEQGVIPITDFDQLLGDAQSEDGDESVEEFLDAIRQLRQSSPARSEL